MITVTSYSVKEQDPLVYYSIYPRENIIASNYILADMQAIWISVTDNKIIKF